MKINVEMIKRIVFCSLLSVVVLFASKYRVATCIQIAKERLLSSYFEAMIGIICLGIYLCIVLLLIIRLDDYIESYKKSSSKEYFWIYFIISCWITIFLYNPIAYSDYSVEKFTGQIGQAIINNIDPSKRINSYYFMMLLFAMNLLVVSLTLNFFVQKNKEHIYKIKKYCSISFVILLLGFIFELRDIVSKNMRWEYVNYSYAIIALLCIQLILYAFANKSDVLSIKKYALVNVFVLVVCQVLSIIVGNDSYDTREFFYIHIIGFFVAFLVLNLSDKKGSTNFFLDRIIHNSRYIDMIYIITGIYIVLSNLNISFEIKNLAKNMDKSVIGNIWEGLVIEFLFIDTPNVLVYTAVALLFVLLYFLYNTFMMKELSWTILVFMPFYGEISYLVFFLLIMISVINIVINKIKEDKQLKNVSVLIDFMTINLRKATERIISSKSYYILLVMVTLILIDFFGHLGIDFRFAYSCLTLMFISVILYQVLNLKCKISEEDYLKVNIIMAMLSFGFTVIIKTSLNISYVYLILVSVLLIANILVIKICRTENISKQYNLSICVFIASIIPVFTSIYIEVINILNQHNVFVSNPRMWYIFSLGIILLLAYYFGFRFRKTTCSDQNWKIWSYICIIMGVSMLSVQIQLQQTYSPWIYESANYSVLISDFLNYGKIPLIEHYGGHMLTYVLEGVLYGVINQDFYGAIVSPYSGCGKIIVSVLLFFLIREIWDDNAAILIIVFYPWEWMWGSFGLSMISCLVVVAYVRKPTYKKAFLVWASIILNILIKLDVGVACAIGCIITVLFYIIKYRNKDIIIKQLVISMITYLVVGVSLWGILCLRKDINPIKRLLEFIDISASNSNWAYPTIGITKIEWVYIVIPFCVIGCLIYFIMTNVVIEKEIWLYGSLFGWIYIANFSRGLVRHSMFESGSIYIVLFSSIIAIAIFMVHISEKKEWFIITVTLGLLLVNSNDSIIQEREILANASLNTIEPIIESWTDESYVYYENGKIENVTYWQKLNLEKCVVERIQLDKDGETEVERVKAYKDTLDIILKENETYVDFCNESFIYSAINRECPVYVSQSPIQLSGTYTQKQYIEQIKDVPVVVMSAERYGRINQAMDFIEHNFRYYLVSDYIFRNYVPLCTIDNYFTIWCYPERYEEMYKKLQKNNTSHNITYDVNLDSIQLHIYEIGYLPYIWANLEEGNNREYIKTLEKKDEYYIIDKTLANEYESVYLTVNIKEEIGMDMNGHNVRVALGVLNDNGEFDEKYYYLFNIKEDISKYLLNISCDAYWHYEDINGIRVECDDKVLDISIDLMGENIEYE
ncbi:MAG: hypothetical protein IJX85_00205 [Lachnospiraceae bacterium]|nr:hypothetical protein [Lachnospiraceae bacterium]